MSDHSVRQDSEYFREVVTPVETHSDWVRTEASPAVDKAVTRAADGELGELFYRHQPTAARLHIRIPDQGTPGALDALLDQPLDPAITETGGPDSFTATLSSVHHRIADMHRTAYIKAHADPSLILTVSIPVEYDAAVWQETVETAATIAKTVDCLHTAIEQSLQEFEADTC